MHELHLHHWLVQSDLLCVRLNAQNLYHARSCRQGIQEYHMHNAFGALTSLASLQAIAALQGAANFSSAGGTAALEAMLILLPL